jgi:hypothetical protein
VSPALELFVAYDTHSGRIVAVHHGPADPAYEWTPQFDASLPIAILRTSVPSTARGTYYAVDTDRQRIVETTKELGRSFDFGQAGTTSRE